MEVEEDRLERGRRNGAAAYKAKKFKFLRKQEKLIDSIDTQWILKIYYLLKSQSLYIDESNEDIINLVSEIACCTSKTVKRIIEKDIIEIEDDRGHLSNTKINQEVVEGIKDLVTKNLKENLDSGIPICTKDIQEWVRKSNNVELSKNVLLNYLNNWGISWRRLKVDEYRKMKESVKIMKLQVIFLCWKPNKPKQF